jgi:hypothetical protein
MRFDVLYAVHPLLQISSMADSMGPACPVFQLRPPILIPCSCGSPVGSTRQAAAASRRPHGLMAVREPLSPRGAGNPAFGTSPHGHGREGSTPGATGKHATELGIYEVEAGFIAKSHGSGAGGNPECQADHPCVDVKTTLSALKSVGHEPAYCTLHIWDMLYGKSSAAIKLFLGSTPSHTWSTDLA